MAVSQARAAHEQARIAGEQRDAAQRASERAERTSRFMQSFLDNANPSWYGRGKGRKDATVREAIDDAAARLDTELADQPEVCADIHYTIGQVYSSHGDTQAYHGHMQRSLELYRQALGDHHPKVARGIYYLSMAMEGTGANHEEVKAFLRQGIAIMRQTDPGNVNLPYMLQQLASWIAWDEEKDRSEAQLAEAENLILEAKTLFRNHYGNEHISTISADASLAHLARKRGDLKKAESIFGENIRRYQQAHDGRQSYIWAMSYLGDVELALGKRAEAEKLFHQSLDLGRDQWGVSDDRFVHLARYIKQVRAAAPK